MAVQQRIIGGGLLLAGIAVVLILIFLFTNRGKPWDEAYAELKSEIYPRYVKAEEAGEYLEVQRIAGEAIQLQKSTAMAAVEQAMRADAAKGDREAQALVKLLDSKAFERNVQGAFALDDGWYDSRSHFALRQLKRYLGEGVPALVDVRRDAKALSEEVEKLRLGSGMELPLAPPDPVPANPVAAADALLFLSFGLRPPDVAKALSVKGASSKAKSARLVWNQPDGTAARARLQEALAKLPALADTIERAAVALGKAERDLQDREEARRPASELVRIATGQIAAVLEGPARQAFEQNPGISAIADVLKQDAKLLKGYSSNAPALGKALSGAFAAE